jgi:hypothetical protein
MSVQLIVRLLDAVRAASRASEDVLDAVHGYAWSEHMAEDILFGTAEALTGSGRGADRAVVFQQQETVGVGAPFGHVAFARTDVRQAGHTGAQTRRAGERGAVGASGLVFAHTYELLQCSLSQRRADRVDETHGKLGVGIREATMRRRRQVPGASRPAEAALLGHGLHETFVREFHQVLPRGFCRRAEYGGDIGGSLRTATLDQAEDPIAGHRPGIGCGITQGHACIMRRPAALRKPELG